MLARANKVRFSTYASHSRQKSVRGAVWPLRSPRKRRSQWHAISCHDVLGTPCLVRRCGGI